MKTRKIHKMTKQVPNPFFQISIVQANVRTKVAQYFDKFFKGLKIN